MVTAMNQRTLPPPPPPPRLGAVLQPAFTPALLGYTLFGVGYIG